jgi:hypothetical protein
VGKIGADPPIADLVRVSQGIARNISPKAHVIEFLLAAPETGLDIAEAFSIGKLGETHTKELIPTGKRLDLVSAPISFDPMPELVARQIFHDLRENGFA